MTTPQRKPDAPERPDPATDRPADPGKAPGDETMPEGVKQDDALTESERLPRRGDWEMPPRTDVGD